MKNTVFLLLLGLLASCQTNEKRETHVVTTDMDNFWNAYDAIVTEADSSKHLPLIDSLYINKGSAGLKAIMEARNYTSQEYVELIKTYPKFFSSLRSNTLKSKQFADEINGGIDRLEALYPRLKPAKIYFTIGCMRTNGTTRDSLVLIGSELAMLDEQTDISEFDEQTQGWLEAFIDTQPLDNLVLLNVHEYVHTQQHAQVNNLLSIALREGIAEFVSTRAMNSPSASPAIEFGKKNAAAVRDKFEQEMFYFNNQPKWLWSNSPNEFGVRDLGYYIGYQMAENYYQQTEDKKAAINTMIELDYADEIEVENFVDQAGFFSASLDGLYNRFENSRPYVTRIRQFENNSQQVDPNINQITIDFSEPLNGYNTGVDFGDLGPDHFPKNDVTQRFWSNDNASWTITVALEPNRRYQILLSNNFRTAADIPLKPYLIDFKTRD